MLEQRLGGACGSGRSVWVHVLPSGVVQAAGWRPCEPTATKPPAVAVTASICLLPAPSSAPVPASPARSQPVSPADHHAAATVRAGVTSWEPTIT